MREDGVSDGIGVGRERYLLYNNSITRWLTSKFTGNGATGLHSVVHFA